MQFLFPSTGAIWRLTLKRSGLKQVTNEVSEKVKSFRLRFFGHLARSAPEENHHRVIATRRVATTTSLAETSWSTGRPRSTWLRVIDEDVQPQNFGVHTAWRKAKERDTWHQVVSTATLCQELTTKKKKTKLVFSSINGSFSLNIERYFLCWPKLSAS